MINEIIAKNPAVVGLQEDVSVLTKDLFTVKEEQHRQGLMLEDVQSNVQRVLETLTPILKKGELVGAHEIVIEQQSRDLAVVKSALRDHINNKTVHRK